MFFSCAHILPMHITIGLAALQTSGSIKAILIFLVMKTIAYIIMHMIEHADARLKQPAAS